MLDNFKFELYYNYLTEQNKIHNLTAITEREDVWTKHFEDSIAAADIIPSGAGVLDIGAGAGFPSVPLKIVRGDIVVTMLDGVKKKAEFLNGLIKLLELDGITAAHGRVEERRAAAAQDNFDVSVARAVARLNILCEYALPFVKIGGIFIAYKSSDIDGELAEAQNALKILGGEIDNIKEYTLGGGIKRKLVIIRKARQSPDKYPRGGNKPRLKPL